MASPRCCGSARSTTAWILAGKHALTCYNNPSNLTVHRINGDGTIGEQILQKTKLDFGIFAHQILPTPSNRSVIMVTRGNKAEEGRPEDPGALKIYSFKDGQLSPLANLPVGGKGGLGYGPRHLDFHPTKPWVYVSVESQNELHMHELKDDNLSPEPLYKKLATAGTYEIHFPQIALVPSMFIPTERPSMSRTVEGLVIRINSWCRGGLRWARCCCSYFLDC
jgi:Lactonase, 7-bladed beta-propeller